MDPQHRLFMEISWEVLEKTGYLPKHYNGSIGVYAGSGTNSYYANNILPNQEVLQRVGPFQATTLNDKDYIASRTSYHLNLKGPSVSVHSACSTSLLAIAEAVEAIRSGQCDMAIAGGSSITAPMNSGHLYQEGSMLSSDGHCRSFDAEGKGTVFSDGAGVVLLKNLEAAERDGDVIYGLVKGIGVNNDGGNKGSFTAPSVEGQSNAIMMAMNDAEIRPDSISYIEAHGTATPLGDPIEMEGLNRAFGKQRNSYCAIGSVKSNMGHMTAAAGVAGFVKTILALNHKTIPPSLGFTNPNPSIDFKNSPFYVNNRPYQLLTWSAKTENSLIGYQEKLQDYVAGNSKVSLSDIAYSLKNTRMDFSHRSILIAEDSKKALDDLKGIEPVKIKSKYLKEVPSEIAFMFPGQGAQFLQMGKSLYEHETVYRKAVDECAELLTNFIEEDIRSIIFSDTDTVETREKLKNTKYAQPALFVTEYALAKLWKSWGIQPTVVCGHSIGEFVAAHMAGVFTLQDALRLIAVRGQMVSQLPEGSMLSVRLSVSELKEILPDSLSIAAINSTKLCVVSGEDKEVDDFSVKLKSQGVANRKLATSHAFHSHMMAPILETFKKEVEKVALNAPSLPIISTVTGARATDAELTSAEYWTNHLRDTVRFSDALETITKLDAPLLLEVGPGQTLITLAKQSKEGRALTALSSLPVPKDNLDSYKNTLNTLGELWLNGLEPDWEAFYIEEVRKKVTLPSYAFDRKPCWIAPVQTNIVKNQVQIEKEVIPQIEEIPINSEIAMGEKPSRKTAILNKISDIVLNASGIELESGDHEHTFLELGLDSLKELVYPLVIKKSSGNRLWDVDGNEYIDALNGFGSCLFGHQPDFIKEALHYQVEQGFEVGPQHPLAGEVCELLCEFTGHDRSALCNTGSEAVLGAMRIARTVTGRSLIVAFSKSYHGINDEVIVRGSKKMKTFPAAPGILSDAVQNMLILEYGSPESLEIIKNRANELAAVLVEPIQSRRPELQPVDFLKEVRKITEASKTVLIFDEIITGFRMHPGGTQALFGIKADLATYGKVIGGGISIGAIAGKGEYMDALDGGYWSFGDDSVPEVGVTYFAGTFVRHPLALASTKASLNHMKERGGQLQERLNKMTEDLALEMNIEFRKRKLPMEINYFGSLWRLNFKKEVPYSELLFVLMREKGIHIWDGFPCYMTDAYIDEDIARIKNAMSESIEELIAIGILPSESGNNSLNSENAVDTFKQINTPPVQGAKLGIDDKGNPAWFVSNPKEKGDYIKIDV